MDDERRLLSVSDLQDHPELMKGYSELGTTIEPAHFERGTPFQNFPYQDFGAFANNVTGKLFDLPVVAVPEDTARRPRQDAEPDETQELLPPSQETRIEMDNARRTHLDGRYGEASALYRRLLEQDLPPGMANSVRFFLGLALLRHGRLPEATFAFDEALQIDDQPAWAKSIFFYRAEAKEALGDVAGAIENSVSPTFRRPMCASRRFSDGTHRQ